MSYIDLYNSKLVSAEAAAALVKSGWVLGMDAAPTQTPAIMEAV